MLGQENLRCLFEEDEEVLAKADLIESMESAIDPEDKIYMITYSPVHSEMPDADFILQHLFNVNLLADYLKFCMVGLFCVESTQKGYPHYHGWYQTCDDEREQGRIAIMKVMSRFGDVKIAEIKNSYRINSYTKQSNALHYYKADVFGQQNGIPHNPISKDSYDDTNWQSNMFMFSIPGKRQTYMDLSAKVTARKSAEEFYRGL